jgi:hypothetical protein
VDNRQTVARLTSTTDQLHLFSKTSGQPEARPAPYAVGTGTSFREVRRSGREPEHTPVHAEFKNECSYTFTSPRAFVTCTCTTRTFTLKHSTTLLPQTHKLNKRYSRSRFQSISVTIKWNIQSTPSSPLLVQLPHTPQRTLTSSAIQFHTSLSSVSHFHHLAFSSNTESP